MTLYCAASLLHFTHNAEYLADYPNLPAWLTRSQVYMAWLGVTAIGALGYLVRRAGYELAGLALIGLYAALGFDGLLHYGRAPVRCSHDGHEPDHLVRGRCRRSPAWRRLGSRGEAARDAR